MSTIQVFHNTKIIFSDTSQISFFGSIPETMLCNIPTASDVIRAYFSLPTYGARSMTAAIQQVLEDADIPKKGGNSKKKVGPSKPVQATKQKKKDAPKQRTPTPSDEEDSQSRASPART